MRVCARGPSGIFTHRRQRSSRAYLIQSLRRVAALWGSTSTELRTRLARSSPTILTALQPGSSQFRFGEAATFAGAIVENVKAFFLGPAARTESAINLICAGVVRNNHLSILSPPVSSVSHISPYNQANTYKTACPGRLLEVRHLVAPRVFGLSPFAFSRSPEKDCRTDRTIQSDNVSSPFIKSRREKFRSCSNDVFPSGMIVICATIGRSQSSLTARIA